VSRVVDPSPIPEIDVDALDEALAAGAPVVDVRTPEEYGQGHVAGAVLLPLGELGQRHAELPTDREVYVICQSGGRSAAAVAALNQHGYRTTNVAGGTSAWVESGRPVVEGPAAR